LGYPFQEGKYVMISLFTRRRAEVEALCRRYHVRRLELFGSAACGQDRPNESDLDFLVEFDPLPQGGYADAYFGLLEGLQSLSGRPVDLVIGSAIKNPYFRESVEHTTALLYGS
jgi:predicted nucleotidyltransferase